jgi:hypothetical protein
MVTATPEEIAAQRWATRMLKIVFGALLAFTALCALAFFAGPVAAVAILLLGTVALVIRGVLAAR